MILISIITPVYNREEEVSRCINSVKALHTDKDIDFEHIITDDGSKDKSIQIINKLKHSKLKFFKHKHNKGVNAARNTCVKVAKGKYTLLLDSDDEIVPEGLQIIKEALKKTKSKGNVYEFLTKKNQGNIMGSSKIYDKPIGYKEQLSGIAKGEFIALVKTSIFSKMLFDENRFAFESIFWNKLAKQFGGIIFINKVVRVYHEDVNNRLCKELQDPKNAQKRINDYTYYLKEFEKDYKKFKLYTKLANIYFKIGYYNLLMKNNSQAIIAINKSLQIKPQLKTHILKFISIMHIPITPFAKLIQNRS